MGLTLLSLTSTPSLWSVRSKGTAQPGTGGLEVVMGGGFCRSSKRQEVALSSGTKRLCGFYTRNQPQSTLCHFSCPHVLYDQIPLERKEVEGH